MKIDEERLKRAVEASENWYETKIQGASLYIHFLRVPEEPEKAVKNSVEGFKESRDLN